MAEMKMSYRPEFLIPAVSDRLGTVVELGRDENLATIGRDFETWMASAGGDNVPVARYVEDLLACLTGESRAWYDAPANTAGSAGSVVQLSLWQPTGACSTDEILGLGDSLQRILESGRYGSFRAELLIPLIADDMQTIVELDRAHSMQAMGTAMTQWNREAAKSGTPESQQATRSARCATLQSSTWYQSTGIVGSE